MGKFYFFLFRIYIVVALFFTFLAKAQTVEAFNTTGAGTWVAPCGITSVTVEVWGAGGSGQSANGNPSAGGGGSGGGYVRTTYNVTAGNSYNFYVGNGGSSGGNGESSWFINSTTIRAVGGNGAGAAAAGNGTYGAGASAPTSGNLGGTIVSTYGGNGGNAARPSNANSIYSGGGGASAGNTTGGDASGQNAGVAPTNGYSGATGLNSSDGNSVGNNGNIGSGGSGGRTRIDTDMNGGNGGNGQIRFSYGIYCSKTFSNTLPITSVIFAGINNPTSASAVSPSYESFCISANVSAGGSYPISLKGNTGGNYTDYFRVYIDWDKNGVFGNNANEIYDIGTITNSTGVDASTLSGNINVPTSAVIGTTKMRVVKNYGNYTDACTNSAYGQTEDYNVNVASPICSTPTTQPTALNFNNVSGTTLSGSFTAAITSPTGYIVLRSTSSTLTTTQLPVNNTTYTAGNNINGARVVSVGNSNTFNDSGLLPSTTYYYFVMSYSTAGCASGPQYLTTNPLTRSVTTTCNTITGLAVNDVGATSATISWSGSGTFIVEYGNSGFIPGTGNTAGAGIVASTNATSPFTISGLNGSSNYDVYVRQSCPSGGYSSNVRASFSTKCLPASSSPTINYINDVEFRGTLNDVLNNNNGVTNGYQDFTGMASKPTQAAGEGINIAVKSSGRDTNWKAWVDWNKDGTFNNTVYNATTNPTGEVMFSNGSIQAISTTFGFVIPANTAAGNYVIRIRNYRSCTSADGFCGGGNYNPCNAFTGGENGEAEDYIITVIKNCSSNIVDVTPAEYCGPGSLVLSARGNSGTQKIRWYDAEINGNLLLETNVDAAFNSTFTTPVINNSTTYWVTSFNGTCETIYRKPVLARIKPLPNLTFNLPPENANFCGDDDRLILTTAGDQEQIYLINEDFEDGGLGVFSSGYGTTVTLQTRNNNVRWQYQSSPMKPIGAIWSPAISSGFAPNGFAYSTSDFSGARVETVLFSTNDYNTTDFTSLNLSFSAYYSFYGDTSLAAGGIVEGFYVEVSTDGNSWTTVKSFDAANPGPNGTPNFGYGTRFENISLNLNAYRNVANLKVRFRYKAFWGDGVAIDNIQLYGNKPLTTSFNWTAPNIGVFQADCTTPYINGTTTSTICIKPSDAQLQVNKDWNISASANLSNGCTTTSSIAIHNQNKIWDTTATNWGTTNWQPDTAIPDIDKCVLVKKPVNVLTGNNFEAKRVKVVVGGTLNINKDSSLKVKETFTNAAAVGDVVVASDANLIQVSDVNTNSGNITVQRDIKIGTARTQYNYLGTPVNFMTGETFKTIYPGNPNVQLHNQANNYFPTSSGVNIPGRGLAVKEPPLSAVPVSATSVTAIYKGVPQNGIITYGAVNTSTATNTSLGFNLLGNPYPSNIDLMTLYNVNGGNTNSGIASPNISATFYFWDNEVNNNVALQQQGSNYSGQAYATYNVLAGNNGTGTSAAGYLNGNVIGNKKPTNYVKVGQGFMIKSLLPSYTFVFNNSIRVKDKPPVDFLGRKAQLATDDRYWLEMVSPKGLINSMAVVYFNNGKNNFGEEDSKLIGSSDEIFSLVDDEKVVIDGRASFMNSDVLQLGTKHFEQGSYTIRLAEKEGVFANGQNVYLKDYQTGIVTNLNENNYSFITNSGANEGRFEIIYVPENVLATENNLAKDDLLIYKDSDNYKIISKDKKIIDIELYDFSGRMIERISKINQKETLLQTHNLTTGVYLIKVYRENGVVNTKKIRK